jgi:cytochrome b561
MMRGEEGYGGGAILFHWITVTLVLLIIPIGLVMGNLDRGALQDTLFITHESLGLTIFALTVARLAWRWTHPTPEPSRDLSRIEVLASGVNHWLLYLVLLAMPVTGYLLVVLGGFPLTYFGLFAVPRLVAENKPLGEVADATHMALQYLVYVLVLMHVAAALHHHLMRRNDVLGRMLPAARRPLR